MKTINQQSKQANKTKLNNKMISTRESPKSYKLKRCRTIKMMYHLGPVSILEPLCFGITNDIMYMQELCHRCTDNVFELSKLPFIIW